MGSNSEIAKWYQGKAVFITGATGFMGKVLVEKLLRSCPEIGPIYILVREKKNVLCCERVEDMVSSCLFDHVRSVGVNLQDRLVAIPGDVGLENLGISVENRRLLQDTVSVVFHLAATVRFDEHLRLAVAMNLEGTKAVLELCKGVKNLCAVVHVSTAYTNCDRSVVTERIYPPPEEPDKVVQYVGSLDDNTLEFITSRLISGHPNTYTFTKALAEHVVASYSTELPIVVVRPSIVSASWKEPQPGWVDSFNGPTAIVVGTSKGLLKSVYGKKNISVDLIPVDVCINLFIAAAWEIGTRKGSKLVPNILVYNCVSSPFKTLTWDDFMRYMHIGLIKYAMNDTFMVPGMTMTTSRMKHMFTKLVFQAIPATLADICTQLVGGKPRFRRYQSKLNHIVALLEFFTTNEWKFYAENVKQLKELLSPADREEFDFDMTKMDWSKYADNYAFGIRRNVLREETDTIPAAQKRIARLKFITNAFQVGILIAVCLHLLRNHFFSSESHRFKLLSCLLGILAKRSFIDPLNK